MPEAPARPHSAAGRLALLCNPRSGTTRRHLGAVRDLGRAVAGRRYHEVGAAERVGEAVRAILEDGVDTLCVVGGDGTLHAVLTALDAERPTGAWPRLAVVPGGTANMTARDLGARRHGLEHLRRSGRLLGTSSGAPKPARRPVLRVERPGHQPVCGMFFGAGAVAAGVGFFQRRLEGFRLASPVSSRIAVVRAVLSMLGLRGAGGASGRFTVALDGEPAIPHRCGTCLVTSLDRLLLDTRPYWGEEDGPLHFTLVERNARRVWANLARLARGRPGRALTPARGYLSRNVQRVELAFDGPFVVDGELYEARAEVGPLRISSPRTVEWLVP